MSNFQVTLPDGSVQSVPAGAAPIDVARSISPRLADDALVAKVNGDLWDLNRPFEADATLQILTPKNPEALEVYRHSTAHLLAAAVLELFPETKLGIGPPIENGFYYDFQRPEAFSPEDLEKIEKKMWEMQAQDLPYERQYMEKEEGLKLYGDQPMKCELITEKRRRSVFRIHAGTALHRFLPRPACAVDQEDQGVQAALDRRRVLEGQRKECAVAAHLRDVRSSPRRSWTTIWPSSKKPRSATIASWARNSTCSASRNSPARG